MGPNIFSIPVLDFGSSSLLFEVH